MIFSSPLWLLALIPWAGVALWLLVGRNPRLAVPFIKLWRDEASPRRRARWHLQRPPIALACVLLAMLLALIGAAKPIVVRRVVAVPVQIIVDHGVTMSGRTPTDRPWAIALAQVRGLASANELTGDEPATGLNTRAAMIARVEAAAGSRDVVVISNQDLGRIVNDSRVVQVPLAGRFNVGLVHVVVRDGPRPSVMVRVRNDSQLRRATIRLVTDAADPTEREIELPSQPAERDYFFELERVGNVVSIELDVDDELRADNRAWLLRRSAAPRVEVRASVSPELMRMIDVYGKHRPASDSSGAIAIVDSTSRLPPSEPSVVVAAASESLKSAATARVTAHAITSHVRDWNASVDHALIARPPGAGWTPVVEAGGQVLVAVREEPARQVWIGFSSGSFARTTDFVIFWTDVFDWLGGNGAAEFRADDVTALAPRWQRDTRLSGEPVTAAPSPGVYRGPDNELRAMSAIDLKFDQSPSSDNWREKLASLLKHPRTSAITDLTRPAMLSSLALIAVAALLWNRDRSLKSTTKTPTISERQAHAVAAHRLA